MQSNLGSYQTMVELAHKAKGPKNLGLCVFIGGYITIRFLEFFSSKAIKSFNKGKDKFEECDINTYYEDEKGYILKEKDKVKIIGIDDDVVLIATGDKVEDVHVISMSKLLEISNFKIAEG